jgi:hypothetical protein
MENTDVDEVMCYLQGSIEKGEIERFRALSVRLGVAGPYGSGEREMSFWKMARWCP